MAKARVFNAPTTINKLLLLSQKKTKCLWRISLPVGFPFAAITTKDGIPIDCHNFPAAKRHPRQNDRREISLLNLPSSNMAKATAMTLCPIPHNIHWNFFFLFCSIWFDSRKRLIYLCVAKLRRERECEHDRLMITILTKQASFVLKLWKGKWCDSRKWLMTKFSRNSFVVWLTSRWRNGDLGTNEGRRIACWPPFAYLSEQTAFAYNKQHKSTDFTSEVVFDGRLNHSNFKSSQILNDVQVRCQQKAEELAAKLSKRLKSWWQ